MSEGDMNVLITGSSGMLGIALCEVLSKNPSYVITGLDLTEASLGAKPNSFVKCDITDYPKLIEVVKDIKPDIVIHTAAYTDVDGCESDPGKAEAINALGTRYVAEAAFKTKADLIYVSTDFVFDGQKKSPYKENDITNPINIYGRSKLDGEKFIKDIMKDNNFFIIRTSWLYGAGGKNFVDVILKKAQTQKNIKVVSDQFGSPTYAVDLAEAIANIVSLHKKRQDIYGIYHVTNSDDCSWYKLAQKSLKLANIYGVELIPIMSGELDRAAERPTMSVLDNSRYERLFGKPLRPWYKALEEHIFTRGGTKDV